MDEFQTLSAVCRPLDTQKHPSRPDPLSCSPSLNLVFNLRHTRTPVNQPRGTNQSRLIHTAPVFQPTSGRAGAGLGGSGGGPVARRSSRYWAEKELERLDEAFQSVAGQAKEQKQAAQRWIRRQEIRMEVRIFPLLACPLCVCVSFVD